MRFTIFSGFECEPVSNVGTGDLHVAEAPAVAQLGRESSGGHQRIAHHANRSQMAKHFQQQVKFL
jgi:hypothetical protein